MPYVTCSILRNVRNDIIGLLIQLAIVRRMGLYIGVSGADMTAFLFMRVYQCKQFDNLTQGIARLCGSRGLR